MLTFSFIGFCLLSLANRQAYSVYHAQQNKCLPLLCLFHAVFFLAYHDLLPKVFNTEERVPTSAHLPETTRVGQGFNNVGQDCILASGLVRHHENGGLHRMSQLIFGRDDPPGHPCGRSSLPTAPEWQAGESAGSYPLAERCYISGWLRRRVVSAEEDPPWAKIQLIVFFMPEWRNGRRTGLKIQRGLPLMWVQLPPPASTRIILSDWHQNCEVLQ